MGPIVVEVRRNGLVEARHRVHAVAVKGGAVVAESGDAGLTCFMRSSSKPIQALPLARARDDLDARDLAIASSSHRATDDQLAAVRALLAKAPATEDDLELGLQEGRPPEKLFHNCSGKHAGMLALCRANGWPLEGYRLPDHPVQQACRDAHAEAAGVDADELADRDRRVRRRHVRPPARADGARVRALRAAAGRDARRRRDARAPRARRRPRRRRLRADALRARLVREGRRRRPALRAPARTGVGVALKSEDGSSRPLGPALAAFLAPLGVALPGLATVPVASSRGDPVGEVAVGDFVTSTHFFTNL